MLNLKKPKMALPIIANEEEEIAIFAAGCFWGVEATFRQLEGVRETQVGYTGGFIDDPNYKKVCQHNTGHAEAVKIIYNPNKIEYKELVYIFFKMHDASQLNRQGPDVGSQYRSEIFYTSEKQRKIAEEVKREMKKTRKYRTRRITTKITKTDKFYPAEIYHQRYFEKNGYHGCVNYLDLTQLKNSRKLK